MTEMMLKVYFGMRRLMVRQDGQGMTEYGLIIALVAIAVIGVLGAMSGKLGDTFSRISSALGTANSK